VGLIQRADLTERIRRAFGIRESGVGATISPEIVPVVLVEDLTGPSVDQGLPTEAFCRITAGASAGVFSECFLVNRAGSAVDLVLSQIWLQRSAAGQLTLSYGHVNALNNLFTLNEMRYLDFRLGFSLKTRPVAQTYSRNQAAVVSADTICAVHAPATPNYTTLPFPATLGPSQFLSIVPDANNTGCTVQIAWVERLRTTT